MKYLTLMIVPYPGADVTSFRIRHRTLKLLGFVFVLLVSAFVMTVFYLRPIFDKANRFDRVVAENRNLAMENRKIRELANRLQQIDKLVSKLQVAQGITPAVEEPLEEDADRALESMSALAGTQGKGKEDFYEAGAGKRPSLPRRAGMPQGRPMDEKSFISRNFNPEIFHFGVDFALKQGTPVKATADGQVISSEQSENLGLCVIIEHKSGYRTLYGHNSRLVVKRGGLVKRGDIIAYSGNTGMSSGPHLHYAIFDKNNKPIDPIPFLQ